MRYIVVILLSALLTISCSKTPDGVVNEKDMARLMVDMHKAEAIYEEAENKYYNDSLKLTLRQSVLQKHNVTPEMFDSTLVWYAHHLEVYNEVYDDVIKILDEEKQELSKSDFTSSASIVSDIAPSKPRYKTTGDTADIWGRNRMWILLPGFASNVVTFDNKPDKEYKPGDKYELSFKLINPRRGLKVYFGVDYKDGATAYIYRATSKEGWNHYKLQSDSAREVKRVYGYMTYEPRPKDVVYLDSIELLRTHIDRDSYAKSLKSQKIIGEEGNKKDNSGDAGVSLETKANISGKTSGKPLDSKRKLLDKSRISKKLTKSNMKLELKDRNMK